MIAAAGLTLTDSRRALLGGTRPKPRTSDDAAQGAAGGGK